MKRWFRNSALCVAGMVLCALPALAAETISYTYDALGRLKTVQSSGDVNEGQSVSTTYDAAGNRTNQTVTGAGTGGGGSPLQLSVADASVTEGGSLNFVVTRSGDISGAASASYSTADGTAVQPGDYTAQTNGTVNFPANQATATISVATIDDNTAESAETMTVTVRDTSSGATLGTATGTINDNDTAGGGVNGCNQLSVIVPQSYSASSSYSGYTGLSGTGAGMRDGIYDTASSIHGTNNGATEWVMMNLGSAQAVGNVVTVTASSTYGGWGATYFNGAVLEKSTDGSTWTSVATVSGGADNVPVTIAVNDTVQYLRLRMSGQYLGVGDFCATPGSGGGSAQLAIGNATATEGGTLNFTVTRSGNTANAVSANYATASGSATSGSDFTANSGTVNFAANQTTATISVATTDNSAVESAETMTVTLSAPSSGATIATATGTGTINDNDTPPPSGGCAQVTAIVPQSYSASSSYGSYAYTGLSGTGAGMRDGIYGTLASMQGDAYGTNQWVMMNLGSAQAVGNVIAADALVSAPGSWGPGDFNGAVLEKSSNGSAWTSVATVSGAADNVPVTIAVNDTVQYLRLRMPTGYLGVGDFCATAGSGGSSAQLSIGNASTTEGGMLTFTVTRSGNTASAVSASYATASGTAISGSDFTAKTGTVSFAAAQTSATISVATTDDSAVESAETMTVTLSAPSSGATIGTAMRPANGLFCTM